LQKKHRADNIEHYKERAKQYYHGHKDVYVNSRRKNKAKHYKRELARYHNDPLTNLKQQIRISLNRALCFSFSTFVMLIDWLKGLLGHNLSHLTER